MAKTPEYPVPTDAELEILHVLWQHGPSTVRFVHEQLSVSKKVGYTGTLKTMQIMAEKGLLLRATDSRSHIYRPAFRQEHTQKALLERFLDTAFGGSALKLVTQALGSARTSPEELAEIRHYINTLEEGK